MHWCLDLESNTLPIELFCHSEILEFRNVCYWKKNRCKNSVLLCLFSFNQNWKFSVISLDLINSLINQVGFKANTTVVCYVCVFVYACIRCVHVSRRDADVSHISVSHTDVSHTKIDVSHTKVRTFRIPIFRILTFRIPQNSMRNVLILYAKRLLV